MRVLVADVDLILLDLRMPDMNGVEFIRVVRRRPLFGVRIVVNTSEPDGSELLRQTRDLPVAAIIKKPWKPHELAAAVQAVMDRWHP